MSADNFGEVAPSFWDFVFPGDTPYPRRLEDGREDMTDRYNTVLDPETETKFQNWVATNKRQGDLADYDMRGWYKNNGTQAADGHFTDEYKKPNHPTFSTGSRYHGVDGHQGGTWAGDDNASTFTPSETNLKNLGRKGLEDYFRRVEPNSKLMLPGETPTATLVAPTPAPAVQPSPQPQQPQQRVLSLKEHIDAAAQKYGVDPRIMYGIHAGESAHGSTYDKKDDAVESSWGPFQLNRRKGLGVEFEKDTGLDVRDPASIPAQTEWVARYISKHGMAGVTGNWFGYHGNKDWDPKWGNAGFGGKAAPDNIPVLFTNDQLLPSYQALDPGKDYSFTDAVKAAYRYDTTLGIVGARMAAPHFAPEPLDWTPEYTKEKLGEFDKATQDYIRETAISPAHVDYLRNEALDRLDADKAIASQGTLGGFAAMLAAGSVDLPAYLAGGVAGKVLLAARGISVGGSIARNAAVFAASDIPLEGAKMALEPGYDAGDAARGIAMATLLGGGLAGLGHIGDIYATQFRKIAHPEMVEGAVPNAESLATARGLSAEAAAPPTPDIQPTRMDKFAKKLGGWADFSVGGRLYHSKNDVIAELAPKLTTVASQDLNSGARDVEGALDFVKRNQAAYMSRVEGSLRKWYKPWADEQGWSAWKRTQDVGQFYEEAQRYHTDPNAPAADFHPKVVGFVEDMRKLFADHLEQAKAYGVKNAEDLIENPFYLPRYTSKEQWRAKRLQHGQEGLESVVEQAIKAGDPELAQRVGTRMVTKAAQIEAQQSAKPFRKIVENDQRALRDQEIAQAKDTAKASKANIAAKVSEAKGAVADRIKAEADAKMAAKRVEQDGARVGEEKPSASESVDLAKATVSKDSVLAAVEEEVSHWKQVEQDLRDEASTTPKAAKEQRRRLIAEADDIKAFHERLMAEAEDAWAEAESRYGFFDPEQKSSMRNPERMAKAEARIERDTRLKSLDKKAQKTAADEKASIDQQRDAQVAGSKERAKQAISDRMGAIQARFFQEAFAKRMSKFEDKFVRRVARKYVETINNSVEGMHADVDRALSVRDTELLRNALRENGIVLDEDTADAIADMIAPRKQRGASNLRKRTVLDENTAFIPNGGTEADAFSIRDLTERDYEKIVDRYTRSMSPHYIMSKHGFQTESAARKYVSEVTAQQKGIDGYNDRDAYMDRRRANYLLDNIYGKDPLRDVDPKIRAISTLISNFSYARLGGSFGMSQTYDSMEIVLRHGFEAFQRGVPSVKQLTDLVKQGGPEADALVRDLQIYAGIGTKGQDAQIIPKFRGLESELADTLMGNRIVKALRVSKGLANSVGHLSGLNVLTDVQHLAAARIYLQTVADVARGVRQIEPRLLADYGLNAENIAKFWNVLQHAKFDKHGIIEDLNAGLLRKVDLRAFDELMGLTRREAYRTIIEPHAGLLPMWASGAGDLGIGGKFLAELKTFSMASHVIHTVGNWRLGPAYVAKSVIGGAAWATMLYTVWAHVKSLGRSEEERQTYLEKAFEPSKMAFNVWSRVGMAGITPDIIGTGLATAQKFGLMEPDPGHQFGQAARASGLVAGGVGSIPVVDMLNSVLDTLQGGADAIRNDRSLTRYEARRLLGLLPLQNAVGVSQAINAMTTNLPQRRH